MENQPLVSIVVVSYNAAETVRETLESVLHQTYGNIELVVSDDCSKDNTVEIAQKWIKQHVSDFSGGVHLLTAEKNQGVCANFNKAIRFSKGKWIKIIAADDILLPNCCSDYIDYVKTNPNAQFMTGKMDIYNENFDKNSLVEVGKQAVPLSIYEKNAQNQLKIAARTLIASGAAVFYSRDLYDTINGYNEDYPFEDWPSVISSLEHGYKINLVPKSTIGYRHHYSLSNKSGKLFNIEFRRKTRRFYREKCFKYLDQKSIFIMKIQWLIEEFLDMFGLNHDNKVGRFIEKLFINIKKIGQSVSSQN